MDHEHVRIGVFDSTPPGSELVPARPLGDDLWELIRSPLYAMQVASGDVVKVLDPESGTFEVMKRGGNVCIQVYLGPREADDSEATTSIAEAIRRVIEPLGGRIDAVTPGLISCTLSIAVGFPVIESMFNAAASGSVGAQWQFANVYDPVTGEPLGWWNG
jgi:hypothetical protein